MADEDIVIKDGLGWLVDGVIEQFETFGLEGTNVVIGWREGTKQLNQGSGGANRIVFTPSDPSGKGGRIGGAKLAGLRVVGDPEAPVARVRALRSWERTISISVWAVDTTKPEDERAQYEATVTLFEWLMRAVERVAPVAAKWGDVEWKTPARERSFGRELVVGMTFTYPLFDVPEVLAHPEAVAVGKKFEEMVVAAPDAEDDDEPEEGEDE